MRVFVTGLGVVSPISLGARATMDGLMQGRRAFAPLRLFDTGDQRTHLGAEVSGLSVADVAPRGAQAGWSRTDAMAVVAAREALAEASLDARHTDIHLAVGGTTGGMFETEQILAEMYRDPSRREPVALMLSHPLSATSDRLVATIGPFARASTLCSACSGGANAILLAATWIRSGKSHRVLAGGADGLCRLTYTGFNALGAVSPDACRPFDRRRQGLSLGEGAAFLVLESEASLRERGALALAELAGWAVGSEAHHITNPEESGAIAAALMTRAIARSGVSTADLDYVNAHGTGTQLNDAMESRALLQALGPEIHRVAVSSCKGQIGHTLGAAGAIEAAMTVIAIDRDEIPPTGGLEEPAAECNLQHVIGTGKQRAVRAALSNSFGFGGTDTVLLFTKPDFARAPRDAPRTLETSRGTAGDRAIVRESSRGASRGRVVITGGATWGALGLRGSRASLVYTTKGPAPTRDPLAFVAKDHFDLARARRMDRASRLLTMAMQIAKAEAAGERPFGAELGAVAGSAYGSVDASAEFIQRTYEKGARLASPMAFPNLVPSSPVGHAAIYLGLRGPVMATHDLGITGEAAVVLACQLIVGGEAPAMLAASVEEASSITERVLGPVCSGSDHWSGVRTEGASAIAIEDESNATARGAKAMAYVDAYATHRGDPADLLREIPAPRGSSLVVVSRSDEATLAALATTAWRDVTTVDVASRAGHHEGLGAFSVVIAAAAIAEGRASSVLVFGLAPDRAAALVITDR